MPPAPVPLQFEDLDRLPSEELDRLAERLTARLDAHVTNTREDLQIRQALDAMRGELAATRETLTKVIESNAEQTRALTAQITRGVDLAQLAVRNAWWVLAVVLGGPEALTYLLEVMARKP